jgi:Mg2+ and Co2+ transporter CorA
MTRPTYELAELRKELATLQELNKDQGRHIKRLLKERAEQDAVIARFVRECACGISTAVSDEQPARS